MVNFGLDTHVGCTVELTQMKHDGIESSLLVKAHQRFRFDLGGRGRGLGSHSNDFHIDEVGLLSSQVEILPELCACNIPRCVREGNRAYWERWAHRPFDVHFLSKMAKEWYGKLVPEHNFDNLSHVGDDPVRFSYYIASILPLNARRQQQLLEYSSTAKRLLQEIRIMMRMVGNRLTCQTCDNVVALSKDIFRMSSEGVGGVFVNTHGFLHDIVTLLFVKSVSLQGQPETAHCWFPGYAWTIANCKKCGSHLGWKFTRVNKQLSSPSSFWGLRRDALALPT